MTTDANRPIGPIDLARRHAHRRPDVVSKLRFFDFIHLPATLQPYSLLFAELAEKLLLTLPDDDELVAALDKLLRESKDRVVSLAAQIHAAPRPGPLRQEETHEDLSELD